jgi:hypothetical protein
MLRVCQESEPVKTRDSNLRIALAAEVPLAQLMLAAQPLAAPEKLMKQLRTEIFP